MSEYKFDRSAFRIMTFQESDATNKFGKDIPYADRLLLSAAVIYRGYLVSEK